VCLRVCPTRHQSVWCLRTRELDRVTLPSFVTNVFKFCLVNGCSPSFEIFSRPTSTTQWPPCRQIRCAAVLQTQVPKLCTDLDLGLLYILILGTYSKFAWENNFLALGVCFLQLCSSAGRRFAMSRSRLKNYRRIVSFPQQKNRWNAWWTGFHWESAFVREIPNPTLNPPHC